MIKILYEDKDILAIDKPSGILVHPDQRSERKTVLHLFVKKYPRLEIVHRLDRETSGVLLLAKNQKAHQFLKNQFQNREVKKIYHAIVSGFIKNDHGIINKPIGRSPRDFRRHLSGRGARGEMREAITEYKVLKRFSAPVCKNFSSCALPLRGGTLGDKNFHKHPLSEFSYLEIRPKTGRTHQIRVHMKFLNHPVACDKLYAPNNPCPIPLPNLPLIKGGEKGGGLSRLALHAQSIEFKNLKGKTVKVESPLPLEFKRVLK